MYAIITGVLTRQSVRGNTCIELAKVMFSKSNQQKGIDKVNQIIYDRMNDRQRIPVEEFVVKIKKTLNDTKVLQEWSYKPSYR